MSRNRPAFLGVTIVLLTVTLLSTSRPASAFTQSGFGFGLGFGDAVPMGHEWITRLAAIELIGYPQGGVPDCTPNVKWCDPNDPRKNWPPNGPGFARNLDISSPGAQQVVAGIRNTHWNDSQYRARYKAIWDVIIGQRWVDIAGYNALTSRDCFNAVAQEAVDVQYDHFMRRWDESGEAAAVPAAKASRERFIDYFVKAAIAPPTIMSVYDGGAIGSTAVEVDRNYFLFGRATHLFQDSFSPEHTVRIADDNHVKVRQVLSYACAIGAEQHSHSKQAVIDYSSGDVIWRPESAVAGGVNFALGANRNWAAFKPSNMKPIALVATEASKDLWAAIIRTMGAPIGDRERVARAEATALANNWLSFDEQEMRTWYDTPGRRGPTYVANAEEVKTCMRGLKVGTDDPSVRARQLVTDRRKCLFNAVPWAGYSDLADSSMDIWFSWRWKNGPVLPLLEPDRPSWQPPHLPADSGTRVRIRSVENGQYMGGKIGTNEWVFCRASDPPLDFIMVGPKENATFRLTFAPSLFLSYTALTGAVKLYNHPAAIEDPANYRVTPASGNWAIQQLASPQRWMWLSGESPYVTRSGDPNKRHSQWVIEGLR